MFVNELKLEALNVVTQFKPHCLFVFKGNWVHPSLIEYCHRQTIPTVNYYPDVSFLSHGSYLPRALPLYDHVFTTKSYGVDDMNQQLGITRASFLPPGFDPELHRPVDISDEERHTYQCDVAFIGTWSPKKESLLSSLREKLPNINLKIWGCQWHKAQSPALKTCIVGHGVIGDEYTKAICGASICLGLLSEEGRGSSSGDLITARTFQIPACATLMLHERNPEVLRYFAEGIDAAFFGTPKELVEKVQYYLENDNERERIATNGRDRSVRDDYAIDGRMKVVLRWLDHHTEGSNGN
ncbi:MAG: glycosyltransferase [Pyrinomonadaceae bacterium]|nr:glycosyltransferase [Pyrinomonadaceae bacterium]